jgi:predicted phosphodiesterase
MRALIISDIHGNIDALLALEAELRRQHKTPDQILVLGDLVDYGPAPEEVIAWVRENADYVVRGNHDHAMATGADCKSSPAYKELSVATREYFCTRLSESALQYLADLPTTCSTHIAGIKSHMVHATPRNPLFEYLRPEATDEQWLRALGGAAGTAQLVLLGHTHVQFEKTVGGVRVVNPGSLGQPKDGDPRGCYALLENRHVELRCVEYDVHKAIARLQELDLPRRLIEQLSGVLRTGGRDW